MNMEIWKDIQGYEGLYQVSSLGNVKSLSKIRTCGRRHQSQYYPERMLKVYQLKNKYLAVTLFKDGKAKTALIHRLIAETFLTTGRKPQVNHINAIRTDNRIENLEWCTASENRRHADKLKRQKAA
jgi:hypothetical protein